MKPLLPAVLTVLALSGPAALSSAQFHGAWLPPPGSLRVDISLISSYTDQWFCGAGRGHCRPGDRDVFSGLATREEARAHSVHAGLQFSPVSPIAAQVEVPFHFLKYEQFTGDVQALPPLESEGLGDLSFSLRTGFTRGVWALSLGYGIEFPTGDFSTSAFIIPLGQGTVNHELFLEGGRSLYPLDGFVEAGVLYRIRGTFVSDFGEEVDWGNEIHGTLGGGLRLAGPWWIKLQARGFRSGRFRTNTGIAEGDFYSVWTLVPGLFAARGGLLWEVWAELPMAGRNTAADPAFGIKVGVDLLAGDPSPASATMAP